MPKNKEGVEHAEQEVSTLRLVRGEPDHEHHRPSAFHRSRSPRAARDHEADSRQPREDQRQLQHDQPVYAIVFSENMVKPPRDLYNTLEEVQAYANSPDCGANVRFKKFRSAEEAEIFLASRPVSPVSDNRTAPNEPTIPLPALRTTDYTALKKAIENDDLQNFIQLLKKNPRYLINTNADISTIIMSGMKYNALHVAARSGKAVFISTILHFITDMEFVTTCYGTNAEDAQQRMVNIVNSFLNTPEKGFNETPLHMAAKYGHVDAVKSLVGQRMLDKTAKNKEGLTAMEINCSRYMEADKAERQKEIELLLSGHYVALYRTGENIRPAKILITEMVPEGTLTQKSETSMLGEEYVLAAYAGPFKSQSDAGDFYQRWIKEGRATKLSDIDKGYERIGRELTSTTETPWAESWFFLPEKGPIRLDSEEGLEAVNAYVGKLRSGAVKTDKVRTRLDFDDSDEENEAESSGKGGQDGDGSEDGREYEEAFEDSLCGLSDALTELSLNSPRVVPLRRRYSDGSGKYATPPSTPPPVYLFGLPTKSDSDLFLALSSLPEDLLQPFGHIRFFMSKIGSMSQRTRADWPAKDSPRASRRITFIM